MGADRTYAVIILAGTGAIFSAFEALLGLPDGMLADRKIAIQNRSMTAAEAGSCGASTRRSPTS